MNRNNALMDLASGEVLWISEKPLGVFFCGETFAFVLNPRTRRAAERVARWHGCRFQFNQANGSAAFMKRGRLSGLLVSRLESVKLWSEHALSRMRTYGVELVHPNPARASATASR